MNRCAGSISLVFALWLAGCASLSTDPRLVGTYSAGDSETLTFMSDGRVFHGQTVNGKEERFFLGYYVTGSSVPRSLRFVGPDTSRFVGTSFHVSENFSSVTANWDNLRKPKDAWQVTYRNTAKTN